MLSFGGIRWVRGSGESGMTRSPPYHDAFVDGDRAWMDT
jgi:hypothetical protein